VVGCAGAFSADWTLFVQDIRPHFHDTFFEIADGPIVEFLLGVPLLLRTIAIDQGKPVRFFLAYQHAKQPHVMGHKSYWNQFDQ